MNEKDRLIDDILNEVSANRGVPYEKRATGRNVTASALVDEILARSSVRPIQKQSETPVIPETPQPKEEPMQTVSVDQPQPQTVAPVSKEKPLGKVKKEKKPKKTQKREGEDLLATITPWNERHKTKRGITAEETAAISGVPSSPIEKMAGVKKTQTFFQNLKNGKTDSVDNSEELLYKKGDAVHPQQEEPGQKEPAALTDVSTKELQVTVESAAREREDIYEPTRMIPTPEQEEKARFRPRVQPDEITGQVHLEGFDAPETPSELPEWENQLVLDREKKVSGFTVTGLSSDADEDETCHQDDGDYHSVQDAAPIRADLLGRLRNVTARLWLTLLLLGLGMLLTVVNTFDVTNGLLGDNPTLLLGLYLFVLVVATVCNGNILFGGLKALFMGCDTDTPAAVGLLTALAQGGVMVVFPQQLPDGFSSMLMGVPALLLLVFNLWGKRLMFTRLYRNMDLVGNTRQKYAVTNVTNKDEAFELGRGLAVGTPNVVYARGCVNLKDFIYHSYAPDSAQRSARLLTMLFPLFGVIGAVAVYFLGTHQTTAQAVLQAVSGFAGGVCVGAPLCVLVAGNLPFARFTKRLWGRKIMLSGYDAVEEFHETDVLTVDASQLFPAGAVTLKSIKSASNQSLDRSIMDVAGVVYMADCPLKPLFAKIIQGQTDLLPEVDTLVYEEEMGISGWVMGYRVLVGTKKLMQTHGVPVPDEDYEEKYNEPGLKAVYLSTQGVLSAVFLVKYTPDLGVQEGLRRAVSAGLGIHVYSCDPNVTREMICQMFNLPAGAVRIMGAVSRRLYKQQQETEQPAKAVLSYEQNAGDLCLGVAAALRLHKVIGLASVLQIILAVLGVVGFTVGLFLVGMGVLSGIAVVLWQLISALFILGLPALLGR